MGLFVFGAPLPTTLPTTQTASQFGPNLIPLGYVFASYVQQGIHRHQKSVDSRRH